MADDSNFLDSPWFQLGAPLAATIATAIAPRHAGPAAAVGMAGYRGINEARGQSQRMSMLRQKQQQEADSEANWYKGVKAMAGMEDPEAPAGGPAPEATANATTQTQNMGATPRVHGTQISPTVATTAMRMRSLGMKSESDHLVAKALSDGIDDESLMTLNDAMDLASKIPVHGRLSTKIRGGGEYTYSNEPPPRPDISSAHRGNKEVRVGIDPITGQEKFAAETGDYQPPQGPEPKTHIVKENGQYVAVVFDPHSMNVKGKIPLGGDEEDPLKIDMTWDQLLVMRATGRITPNMKFNAYITPEAANEMLKKKRESTPPLNEFTLYAQPGQNANPLDVKPGQ